MTDMSASNLSPHPGGLRPGAELLHAMASHWWMLALRGVAAIVFGVLALLWPGVTLFTLVILYGAFAFVDGVLAIGEAVVGGTNKSARWWLAVVGVAGIAAGIITLIWPGSVALILLLFIAAWAIVTGVFQIIGAIRLRKEIDNEWLLILSGVLSVIFGIILLTQPAAGALAIIWVIAFYAILYGAILLALAFKLKKHKPA